jgi:hypothetical protein
LLEPLQLLSGLGLRAQRIDQRRIKQKTRWRLDPDGQVCWGHSNRDFLAAIGDRKISP